MEKTISRYATVADALELYAKQQKDKSGKRLAHNLRTVFNHYLPINSPTKANSVEEKLNALSLTNFLNKKPLQMFEATAQEAVNKGQIKSASIRTTYRPALVKFLDWIQAELAAAHTSKTSNPEECTPRMKPSVTLGATARGNRSHRANPYGLYPEQLPKPVCAEIEKLRRFWTDKEVPNRQDKRMRLESFNSNVEKSIRLFLGWLHYHQGWKLENLSVDLFLTDGEPDEAEDLTLLRQFIAFGVNERGNSYGWALTMAKAPLAIAKWKYAARSRRSNYQDIELIGDLRLYMRTLSKNYQAENATSKIEKSKDRFMTFEQQVAVVEYLRQCCLPYRNNRHKRSDQAVMRSWIRYLVVAILTYCPVRQRELRELELGRTLFREEGYRVHLKPQDNKTGDERDFRLIDILPPQIISDLDTWLDHHRAKFIEQAKAASESMESWLAFLGCDALKLKADIDQLNAAIETYTGKTSNREYIKLMRHRIRLQNVCDAREQLSTRLEHQYVFFLLGGTTGQSSILMPYSRENIEGLVTTTVHNSTAILIEQNHPLFAGTTPRRTNPHFFRNNAVTHERRHSNDPARRQAFHKVIGNSVAEGDRTYNQMQPAEKTAQAKNWWACAPQTEEMPAHLQTVISNLSEQDREVLRQALNARS